MSHPEDQPVQAVADALSARFGAAPPTAIVLGSGLGVLVDRMADREIETTVALGLPQSTVAGHAGKVVRGRLGEHEVVALAGRVHLYEGWSANEVVRYVRAFHRWGVKRLVLTCSAGGINPRFRPGDLMLFSDHINLQGTNPLVGPVYGDLRFPDLTHAHHPGLRAALRASAARAGARLHEGVYVALLGPAYETPAEIRMMRTLGADAVGMSTVPEVIAATQIGLPVCAVALISNVAAGLSDEALDHDDVQRVAGGAGARLAGVIEGALGDFEVAT